MILIKNRLKKISINQNKIKKDVTAMLYLLGYQDFDLGIWLTTNKTIQKYNQQYRKKNKPTDILSFPYHTDPKPGQKITVKNPEDKNLGDIIISLEYTKKDASKLNCTLQKRMQILLAHGISHLLGYTHETDKEYAVMNKFEQKLLKSIK